MWDEEAREQPKSEVWGRCGRQWRRREQVGGWGRETTDRWIAGVCLPACLSFGASCHCLKEHSKQLRENGQRLRDAPPPPPLHLEEKIMERNREREREEIYHVREFTMCVAIGG